MSIRIFDQQMMIRALQLAERGLYSTHPNPRVGCVITQGEQIVGEGYHQKAGEGHAEVHALQAAAGQTQGSCCYVTLEPCSHHGKTPPCADALIAAGVARVVVAMQDPNPLVAGQGIARLRQAGIVVEVGLMQEAAQALNLGFIKRMRTGLPYVRAKIAMSVDARTAMASGESQWISCAASREDVQRLRAKSSAIITGSQTVLQDNPRFTIRPEELGYHRERWLAHPARDVLRVVVDGHLATSPQAQIYQLAKSSIWVATHCTQSEKLARFQAQGIEVKQLNPCNGRVDLAQLLRLLATEHYNEILVESGSGLIGAMLQQQLVDELVIYMAPKLMGHNAMPMAKMDGMQQMLDSLSLKLLDLRQIGDDIRLTYQPCYPTSFSH